MSNILLNLPKTTPDKTLKEARDELLRNMQEGNDILCPCCGQTSKIYSETVSFEQVKAMRFLREAGPTPAAAFPQWMARNGGRTQKLKHRRFIEETKEGWALTFAGRMFLQGEIRTPKYVYLFDGKVVGQSFEEISVYDVRGFQLDDVFDSANLSA